jgi:hypothetical protein
MDYNFDNIFLYGLWNGPIFYNVLIRYHILKIKFVNFCMMAFVRLRFPKQQPPTREVEAFF